MWYVNFFVKKNWLSHFFAFTIFFMKKTKLILLVVCSAFLFTGCSKVTIKSKGSRKITRDADYSESKTFWIAGLVGSHSVDVQEVCGSRRPVQMQTVSTFVNRLLQFLTFTIYSPRTAKVWCGKEKS